MSSVPYIYVNIIALCSYMIMLGAFLAAKKNAAVWQFMAVLFGFILWTGGSICMRLQLAPGVSFWYYVSILALFSLADLIYLFVCQFAGVKGFFIKILWTLGTVIILAVTLTGAFLAPPEITTTAGGVVFMYTVKWPVIIPCAFFLVIVCSIVKIFYDVIKTQRVRTPGITEIILGCLCVVIGNMMQLIPGNVFPWDTLSGIAFALLLMIALYRKRMFQLTPIVSKSALMTGCLLLCIIAAINFVSPMESYIIKTFPSFADVTTAIILIIFGVIMLVVYFLIKKLIDALFSKDGQQNAHLKAFSAFASRTLNTEEILSELTRVIREEVRVAQIYVCLRDNGYYVVKHSSNPLTAVNVKIRSDSPFVTYLRADEGYLVVSEFKGHPLYLSMWDEEKTLIKDLGIGCVVPLKDNDNVVGLVLVTDKDKSGKYNQNELSFIATASSVASIAIKNAGLYEQMFEEARIDSLTGVYNYRYFVELVDQEFEATRDDSLALIYVDIDDFKLYNQLYGSAEGDNALKMISDFIVRSVGGTGTVFRTTGKVFAILLPHYDTLQAEALAHGIHNGIAAMNTTPERNKYKALSVSCGICVSPYAASSAKELSENADMAAYNAKNNGKNTTVVFRGAEPVSQRVSERAHEIVERSQRGNRTYKAHSPTILALTAAIDAKDHYTYRHSQNVARYSAILATAAGLNEDQICMIYEAALLHDIGKISIPEHILNKDSDLTDDEYHVVKDHVNNSIEMIRHLPSMDYLIPAAVGHHERWDGLGYPRGISGEEIPISARCLAVADAFDAMTSDRPYREGKTIDFAVEQIQSSAGTQFDPDLAYIFIDLVRCGEITLHDVWHD